MSSSERSLRDELRSLPVFAKLSPSPLDAASLPLAPLSALVSQLREAMAVRETEPHAMTLSTVGASGAQQSRAAV